MSARIELPKRFYKLAEAIETDGLFAIALDGRKARTPAKELLAMPSRPLADAVAAEWSGQGERIDPTTMPLTRLVNVAIDGVAREVDAVAAEIVRYAGSDLVCYRADTPDRLIARQSEHWDPVLAFARDDLGARFMLARGVMFVEQLAETLEAVRHAVPKDDPFALAALSVLTTLTGSALIALALHRRRMATDEAWAAAVVDEAWSAELWGEDAEATIRQSNRRREFESAIRVLDLVRS